MTYLGEAFTTSSEVKTVKGKPKCVPSLTDLCTLGSKTPLLCSIPYTGCSCCPARTTAKLIHRDWSHTSFYLLGIVLELFSYLSKSIKSACDCTFTLVIWAGGEPQGKAACELFNLLSVQVLCLKSIKQYGGVFLRDLIERLCQPHLNFRKIF